MTRIIFKQQCNDPSYDFELIATEIGMLNSVYSEK